MLTIAVIFLFCNDPLKAQDFESTPPVVVKCSPEAGRDDVAPGVLEIHFQQANDRPILELVICLEGFGAKARRKTSILS